MTYRAIVTVYDPWGQPHSAGGETVFEEENTPIYIGLLDAGGVPIYRCPDRRPIGFDLTPRA